LNCPAICPADRLICPAGAGKCLKSLIAGQRDKRDRTIPHVCARVACARIYEIGVSRMSRLSR
jgi:hypothetical protein